MTLPDSAARDDGRAPFAFYSFLALMTSVVAMTIDAVLPALDAMAEDLAFGDPNDRQLVVMLSSRGSGRGRSCSGRWPTRSGASAWR